MAQKPKSRKSQIGLCIFIRSFFLLLVQKIFINCSQTWDRNKTPRLKLFTKRARKLLPNLLLTTKFVFSIIKRLIYIERTKLKKKKQGHLVAQVSCLIRILDLLQSKSIYWYFGLSKPYFRKFVNKTCKPLFIILLFFFEEKEYRIT